MRRTIFFLCFLCLSLLLANVSAQAQGGGYSADFEGFANATPASAITVPGITFSGNWQIFSGYTNPPYMVNNLLGTNFNTPLTMQFAEPQSSIQFGYITCFTDFVVTAYRNGTAVGSQNGVTLGCARGTSPSQLIMIVSGSGFDSVVISDNTNMGIDNIVTLPVSECGIPPLENAVVGRFIDAGTVYWEPGKLTAPVVTIGVGESAWVYGLDPTGEYYQIAWACQVLWVPKASMGPNYDEVWQGRPLPTNVVGE